MSYINSQSQVQAVGIAVNTDMVAAFDQAYENGYTIGRVIIAGPQCPTGYQFELYLGGYAGSGILIASTPKTDTNDASLNPPQAVQAYQNVFGVWRNVIGNQVNGQRPVVTLVLV